MPRKELTIEEADALATRWEAMAETYAEACKLASRFNDAGPSRVVEMWRTGRNEKGKRLTKFETQALGDRWCELFGSLPPSVGESSTPPAPPQPVPADDAMLHMPDVERMTGLGKSTIKRKMRDGSFPMPTKISTKRIGWPAHKVKAWIADREAGQA